jgi:hypothetical protein
VRRLRLGRRHRGSGIHLHRKRWLLGGLRLRRNEYYVHGVPIARGLPRTARDLHERHLFVRLGPRRHRVHRDRGKQHM